MRIIILLLTLITSTALSAEVNIYSHRQSFLIQPMLEKFTEQTNIKVNIIYAPKGGLLQRLKSEGKNSPADIVLTSDISDMIQYANNNLLIPHNSQIIKNNIPEHLRDDNTGWFALSKRARILAISSDRQPQDLSLDIEDLADPKWHGKICTRKGSHPYNRALMASLIAAHGKEAATKWGKGLVANLARKPQGNDRAQAKAISEGLCDIALMNSYYYGKMKFSKKAEQKKWAKAIRLGFTNQKGRGNHINISAAALSVSSKNQMQAIKLLEFLTSAEAQSIYAEVNFEYPANPKIKASKEVASWGTFKEDSVDITDIAKLSPQAQKIIDIVKW